jgi:hypothetical protein
MKKLNYFYILIFALALFSCKSKPNAGTDSEIVASVNEENLYKKDIVASMPVFQSKEDSLAFVKDFVDSWVAERLLYAEAKIRISDTTNIVKKINDYRRQLYIHYYKESVVFADIKNDVSREEIEEYYNKNLSEYVLATSYVKAHYMTMDAKVTTYSDEFETLSRSKAEDKKLLKDYCLGTGRKVFFIEEWTEIRNFLDLINYSGEFSEAELGNRNVLDYINGDLRYLVKIDEYRTKGDYLPLELAIPEITQIIVNKRKEDKLNQVKKDLRTKAENDGSLLINK